MLNPPATWSQGFDFVLESYTLQVLPPALRSVAISNISRLIAPPGQLFVIARGRAETDPAGQMPYPLARRELATFENLGLSSQSFEDYLDNENPPVRRFRALYTVGSTA